MEENKTDLPALFARLGELMYRHQHRSHRLHGPAADPHRGQGRVMALLKMQPEISQRELSFLLDIRPQSLGELLAKLERAGYIEREASATDRRVMDIRLTDKGREAAEPASGDDSLFRDLDDEERERLGDYLSRIIARLEEDLADDRSGPWDEEDRPCPHGRHGRREGHPGMDRRFPPPHHRGPHGHPGPHGPHDHPGPHGPHDHPGPHGHHGAEACRHGEERRHRGCCGGRHGEHGGHGESERNDHCRE